MTTAEIIALATIAIQLAQAIRGMALDQIIKDDTLTPEKKMELIKRIEAAQNSVTPIP